jgi:hypothetical protein
VKILETFDTKDESTDAAKKRPSSLIEKLPTQRMYEAFETDYEVCKFLGWLI